jgi:hypothetical protein
MTLTEKEKLFLEALCSYPHGHVTQDSLRGRLEALGFTVEEFKDIKKRLLYSGVIGIVYGNITLEDESLRDQLLEE